mmetsp:Transcript_14300/g.43211  ORF Transcript_14300/g.43211 Transcript_14300/m.43211 type:complete len:458 (+) Transcript_14300:307-1680(+)
MGVQPATARSDNTSSKVNADCQAGQTKQRMATKPSQSPTATIDKTHPESQFPAIDLANVAPSGTTAQAIASAAVDQEGGSRSSKRRSKRQKIPFHSAMTGPCVEGLAGPSDGASLQPAADINPGDGLQTTCPNPDQDGSTQHLREGSPAQRSRLPKPPPPTHFLAVPLIGHASIEAAMKAVQASLIAHDPRLKQACAALCTAHITLAVLYLPTGEDVQRGRDALASLGSSLRKAHGTAPATGHTSAPAASGTASVHTDSRGDEALPTASPFMIAQGALPSGILAGGDAKGAAATQLLPSAEPADPPQLPGSPDSSAAAAAAAEDGSGGEGGVLQPFTLTFSGLSTFKDRVLYLDPVEDSGLTALRRLAAAARAVCTAAGVPPSEVGHAYSPHLTVAKLSQLSGRARSIRRFAEEAYWEHLGVVAGPVAARQVQLCAMMQRPHGKYYRVEAAVPLLDR